MLKKQSNQPELIAQNMFEVYTEKELTPQVVKQLKQKISTLVNTSWIDISLVDFHTVNILLETTDDVDDVSSTIATIIQKGTDRIKRG